MTISIIITIIDQIFDPSEFRTGVPSCFIGNMQIGDTETHGTWHEFMAEITRRFPETVWIEHIESLPGGGWVCTMTPDGSRRPLVSDPECPLFGMEV